MLSTPRNTFTTPRIAAKPIHSPTHIRVLLTILNITRIGSSFSKARVLPYTIPSTAPRLER
jgi:hypothetical protein